ncbi:MAG: TIGR00341 family protein [Dehalococcoidia bacterium]
MPLRMMQVFVPERTKERVLEGLGEVEVLGAWRDVDDRALMLELVLPGEHVEAVMDNLATRYGEAEGFRIVLSPVEGIVPRLEDNEAVEDELGAPEPESRPNGFDRVSREELYNEVTDGLVPDRVFLGMAALSALVAAVGLLRDDVAVIIGAMVIAPLLGPNVALSLATALGDTDLVRRSIITNIAGVATATVVAVVIGLFVTVNPLAAEISTRTSVDLGNLLLALGAGAAGTLAYTRGLSGAVIGVMVAVALMPPLVTAGMLVGEGEFQAARGAFVLTVTNVIGINLAGTLTFVAQGVRPRLWWEAERARRRLRTALIMWLSAAGALVLVLLLASR